MTIQSGLALGLRKKVLLDNEALSTATRTSEDVESIPPNDEDPAKAYIIKVVTDDIANTPTWTPSIQWKGVDGNYTTIWTAASAISTDTTTTYYIGPDVVTADDGSFTESVAIPIPAIWRFVLTYAGTPANDKQDTYVEMEAVG